MRPECLSEKLVRSSPGWAVSGLLHLSLLVLSMYIIALWPRDREDEVLTVRPHTPPGESIRPACELIRNRTLERVDRIDFAMHDKTENEASDDEEFEKAKGESSDALSDKPFKGTCTYDTIGGGGGGGSKYGSRFGCGSSLANRSGCGGRTEDAVMNALRWLARHQNRDGAWSARGHAGVCGQLKKFPGTCMPNPGVEDYNVGLTGLSLLAFLGAGYTHLSRDVHDGIDFGEVVKKGLQHLMRIQTGSGCVGSDGIEKQMYNHLLAAFALSEAHGMTSSPLIKDAARKAVDYTVQAQNPGRGWRYSFRAGDNDSSVSGWAMQVLKSAEVAEFYFSRDAYQGALAWFDECTIDESGHVGYLEPAVGKVVTPANGHFQDHPALTAIGIMSRIFVSRKGDPEGVKLLMSDLPEWTESTFSMDMYYWYYASFAMFQVDGPNGASWKRWNKALKAALLDSQLDGPDCRNGSWPPVTRWASEGGRVYTTAIGALTMEVYYRYPVLFVDRKADR